MIKREDTRLINCLNVIVGPRFFETTPEKIKTMAASMNLPQGQLTPIIVYPVTSKSYQLVAGLTRLRAAIDILRWQKIRAEVIYADDPRHYKVIELTENIDRRDLTRDQRRTMRQHRKELQRQIMESVEPAKAGRGKKGGIREAAREAGISKSTAHRRQHETDKLSQNPSSGTISDQPTSTAAQQSGKKPLSTHYSPAEYNAIKAYADQHKLPMGNVVREAVRQYLSAHGINIISNAA